jgi:hypothetical protein
MCKVQYWRNLRLCDLKGLHVPFDRAFYRGEPNFIVALIRKEQPRCHSNWYCKEDGFIGRVSSIIHHRKTNLLKEFSNASFPPETIGIMKDAMDAAVATLPEPISSAHVKAIAETILRTAEDGERDPAILQRMALLELQITPRN